MKIFKKILVCFLAVLCVFLCACSAQNTNQMKTSKNSNSTQKAANAGGIIPKKLSEIPKNYKTPAKKQGRLEKLTYSTWESLSYEKHSKKLTKTAWVYLPYGYTGSEKYNIFYLSHGGWSNETTIMGTAKKPNKFKNVIDNAMQSGLIRPMIIVMPTYNNTGKKDSWDYSLALKLTDRFHNELINDLIPAAEGKYSTFAAGTSKQALKDSRNHRGFGGFSMGSVNTWCTFRYCLDYFRYFMPMSGSYTTDGAAMADMVKNQGRTSKDFFIYAMSGPDDFAYSAFKEQVDSMEAQKDTFITSDNEKDGNIAFREMSGYEHGPKASNLYTYNGLQFFWQNGGESGSKAYTENSKISDVINDPVFSDYGRLIFPADKSYYSGGTLGSLRLTWYSDIQPKKTVEICNRLHSDAANGQKVFYSIYTDAEKKKDPLKKDTGLFFFKGKEGEKFAICNAGGGFAYVGAMQDSFPHALELSKKGYNAFALIYRPGAQTACEDLARAIAFIFNHASELGVSTNDYSLWGGSAGARMAAWLGSYGTESFGEKKYPRPAAVIMQYTGLDEVYGNEPPTYNCVGTNDYIADYRTMRRRINAIKANGTNAKIEIFKGLSHGFGLGQGTVAEGWLDHAVKFWEDNSK